jgi:predicted acetyltransferase
VTEINETDSGPEPPHRITSICLELPSTQYVESFFQAAAEFEAEGIPQISTDLTEEQFSAYVQGLHDLAAGKNLKRGYVPSKEFWIIDSDGYAGRIILGLSFVAGPDRLGHHVGYAVRPSKRQRGYATKALEHLLVEARNLGILKLMPECARNNLASRKVIERNGGVLLEDLSNDDALKFLIDLKCEPEVIP